MVTLKDVPPRRPSAARSSRRPALPLLLVEALLGNRSVAETRLLVPRPRGSSGANPRPRPGWLRRVVRFVRLRVPFPVRVIVLPGSAVLFAVVAGVVPVLLPIVSVLLFVVVASTALRPWYLVVDAVVVGAVVTVVLSLSGRPAWSGLSIGLVMVGAAVLGTVLRRDRIGMVGTMGGAAAADAMLVDLRNRVRIQSTVPALPPDWRLDTDLRSAHGDSFSGDFVVTAAPAANRLEVVLVDVSGKGQVAGSRALLLAGAFEALLDAVPRDRFLPAANQHVLRHGDDEGFATAIHVSLDLTSGGFTLSGAGHPPAAHYRAGSGRWTVLDGDQGPALGLLPDVLYPSRSGVLSHGDALLLFTDGLVESRRLDVVRGIDRLTGHADALIARNVPSVAARIAEAIRAEQGDDRALVVIRRT